MKKNLPLIITVVALVFSATLLHAQPLFSISQNSLPAENITQLKTQIEDLDIVTSSFPVSVSSIIIILNEETGNNVTISPVNESLTEFQLTPFFIEELRQGVLGNATRYVILETTNDFSVKNIASVSAAPKGDVFVPQYFYGEKGNVKEALPKERQIINILKQKPKIISESPDNYEHQQQLAQMEEAMSYYVYMYKLPDGTLCTYDEHFNPKNNKTLSRIGNYLEFNLSGVLNETQRFATEYALQLWSEQLAGSVPVDICVDFLPLGQGVLGMTFFPSCFFDNETTTWYPSALWNQMIGYNASGEEDIQIIMNSNYGFYFGLDGKGTKTDWVTVMIHETTHGLGFGSQCHTDGSYFYGAHPVIYDRMLYQGLTGPCLTELTESERATLIISNNLYAGSPGSNLLAAHNDTRVKMYAPTYYSPGSSAHHWDGSVNFPTFMKYAYERSLHTFNTCKIGILMDLGWTLPVVEPNALWVTFNTNSGSGNMLPQQFLPDVAQKLKINPFSKKGYTFTGWNSLPDGTGTTYADRELITISNDLELYAQWEANTYTLTFYANGGTVSPTSKQVIFDMPIGELPIPVLGGCKFEEWKLNILSINEETIWKYDMDRTALAIFSPLTGIVETGRETPLQVIPNPANYTVELRISPAGGGQRGWNNYELQIERIEFYNVFGQLVKSVPFAGETNKDVTTQKINISDLSGGVYMVKAGEKTVKLIVN